MQNKKFYWIEKSNFRSEKIGGISMKTNTPMTAEEKIRQLSLWLEKRLTEWEFVNANGSQDLIVSTGAKLNEIRGQILLLRRDIRLLCDTQRLDYPPVAYEPVPPPVSDSYCVRPDIGSHREVRYECVAESRSPKQICLF